MKAAYDITN